MIFLDLEDSVAPDDKPRARKNIIKALNTLNWGQSAISVRINGLDTHYMYRDVVDVIEQGGDRLDLIMIPKVGTAADVYAVDMLVTQVEDAIGRKKRIGFELIIESAMGMANIDAIAAASPRIESLHFGVADYAASTGGPDHRDRRPQSRLFGADRPGQVRRPARALGRHVALRGRPHGGGGPGPTGCAPSTDRLAISAMPTGFGPRQDGRRFWGAKASGPSTPAKSRWRPRSLIHPKAEISRARKILKAMKVAQAQGLGRRGPGWPHDRRGIGAPSRGSGGQGQG